MVVNMFGHELLRCALLGRGPFDTLPENRARKGDFGLARAVRGIKSAHLYKYKKKGYMFMFKLGYRKKEMLLLVVLGL